MKLSGILHLHSETGTEGGYWAFQDERFMGLPPPNQWRCETCGAIWSKDSTDKEPEPIFIYFRPKIKDHSKSKQLWLDDDVVSAPIDAELSWEPRTYHEPMIFAKQYPNQDSPDSLFYETLNARSLECYKTNHIWISPHEIWPDGVWSYEGLRILTSGDHLTIYDKEKSTVIWEGEITLDYHDHFTESVQGVWINSDETTMDRETWSKFFFYEHPAELIVKGNKKMGQSGNK